MSGKQGNIKGDSQRMRGFMTRLRSDVSGNTIAIVAGSMIPLTAVVGTAIDMSRVYMAETRLQQACDAGALIGRKVQAENDWAEGQAGTPGAYASSYFSANFQEGQFGTENLTFNFGATESGEVEGSASAKVKMTISSIIGLSDKQVSVDCEAIYNNSVSNADIMMVLDTTGSMSQKIRNSDAETKIATLRAQVVDFHADLEAKKTSDGTLRFGFMPYSTNVNVGHILYAENPDWLATSATYQSRQWGGTTEVPIEWGEATIAPGTAGNPSNTSNGSWSNTATAAVPSGYSANPAATSSSACTGTSTPSNSTPTPSGSPTTSNRNTSIDPTTGVKTITYNSTQTYTKVQYRYNWSNSSGGGWSNSSWDEDEAGKASWGKLSDWSADRDRDRDDDDHDDDDDDNGNGNGNNGTCSLQQRTVTYTVRTPMTSTQNATDWEPQNVGNQWLYKPISYETATYLTGVSVSTPTGTDGANESSIWGGCIEERDTVPDSTFAPIAEEAYDLDIDLIPNSNATRWKPSWPEAVYLRDGPSQQTVSASNAEGDNFGHPGAPCPVSAIKLGEMSNDDVQEYVDDLVPTGNTYHDFGMIWGARFISPTGIFAGDNADAVADNPTERHIVFMTDGELAPDYDKYGLYGVEQIDGRITENESSVQYARHEARFEAACRAARNLNITVWVIGFGTTLSDAMYRCAGDSPSNKANAVHTFQTNNATQLADAFSSISSKVGDLRLGN